MQESVIYQDIFQKGEQRGLQKGRQEGEAAVILRQLHRRFRAISPETEQQIRSLSTTELENLAEALLDFSGENDLVLWLETHT